MGGELLGLAQLFGIVVHDDDIAHEDAHERDDTEIAGERELAGGQEHARRGAEHHKRERQQQQCGHLDAAEMGEHEEEDDDHADHQSAHDLWRGLAGLLVLAAPCQADAGGQAVGREPRLQRARHFHHVHAIDHVGHDGDGAHAVEVGYLPVLPRRTDRCHLSQGHRLQSSGHADRLVGNVGGGGEARTCGLDHHGNAVVAVPDGGHGDAARGISCGKGHLHLCVGDAEAVGTQGVKAYVGGEQRLVHVVAHQQQTVVLSQPCGDAVGRMPEQCPVVATQPYLHGVALGAVTQLLEPHVCPGKGVGVLHAVVGQQSQGGLVVMGVDNKLGVVLPAKLRCIRCLEAWRCRALERGDRHHPAVAAQDMLQ